MADIQFDVKGHLFPPVPIQLSHEEIRTHFVWGEERQNLWSVYEKFNEDLSRLLPIMHRQWIDGSFATQKGAPNDIDLVIFVPTHYFASVITELRRLKQQYSPQIDCYFVEEFPKGHPKVMIGQSDELTWYYFFRSD
ncbi:MAG: hypothetical protein EAZ91_11835 [Cytophagales bacterium]|nr:MAG: hypothetical protein EAZ91_11835 [Cytophagales bacterium]